MCTLTHTHKPYCHIWAFNEYSTEHQHKSPDISHMISTAQSNIKHNTVRHYCHIWALNAHMTSHAHKYVTVLYSKSHFENRIFGFFKINACK